MDRKDVIFRRVLADVEDVTRIHVTLPSARGRTHVARTGSSVVRIGALVDIEDGNLVLRSQEHEGSPCTRRAPSHRVSHAVEALLDIEDVTTAMDPCQGCSNNPDTEENLVQRWLKAGEGDEAALARRKKATTQGACGRQLRPRQGSDAVVVRSSDPPGNQRQGGEALRALPLQFLGCAICPKGHHDHPGQACAACNCGLKVITRNTFLTVAEEGEEEDEWPRRRFKSL